jgi:hypothetical protein
MDFDKVSDSGYFKHMLKLKNLKKSEICTFVIKGQITILVTKLLFVTFYFICVTI